MYFDTTPEERVATAIFYARLASGLTQRQLYDRVSDHYTLGYSTYQGIEASAKRKYQRPAMVTQPLVRVIAAVLDVPVSQLASDEDFAALRTTPRYKPKTKPNDTGSSEPVIPRYVHEPEDVCRRLEAFVKMYNQSIRSMAMMITRHGYKIHEVRLRRILHHDHHLLDHDLLDAAAAAFTQYTGQPFSKDRFLICEPDSKPCPHCRSYLT